MKCFYCGAEIADTSKFCPNCGAKVEEAKTETLNTDTNTESKYQSGVSAECYEVVTPETSAYETKDKNKSNGNFAIASLVCSLAGLVIPCCFIIPQILGIIFGIIGLKSDKKGMGIAGIIISAATIVLSIILVIIYFSFIMSMIQNGEFNFDVYPEFNNLNSFIF